MFTPVLPGMVTEGYDVCPLGNATNHVWWPVLWMFTPQPDCTANHTATRDRNVSDRTPYRMVGGRAKQEFFRVARTARLQRCGCSATLLTCPFAHSCAARHEASCRSVCPLLFFRSARFVLQQITCGGLCCGCSRHSQTLEQPHGYQGQERK